MKYKDEGPDNLGGLGDMLPAEVLKMLNELLEQMHQTDFTNHGSKIEVVYVASGGQHVETQINVGAHPNPPQREGERSRTSNTARSTWYRESHAIMEESTGGGACG